MKRRRDRLQAAGLAALEQKTRDLLDVASGTPPVLARSPATTSLRSAHGEGELADHLRNVGAIEGAE